MLPTYAFLDPASGKVAQAKIRAQSAIVVIHPDALGRIFVLHAWSDRVSTPDLLDLIYSVNDTFRPKIFGCEANAMQSLFTDLLTIHSELLNRNLPLHPHQQPTQIDKDFRIRSYIQPILNNHKLFFCREPNGTYSPGMTTLRSQLEAAPHGILKDLIDALASCIAIAPPRTTSSAQANEEQRLLAYCQRQGLSNDITAKHLARLRKSATLPTRPPRPTNLDV